MSIQASPLCAVDRAPVMSTMGTKDSPMLHTGTIATWSPGLGWGWLDDGRQCRAAASCLVEPMAGDRVLLALEGEAWVLAVLARQGDRSIRLAAPVLTMTADAARFDVAMLETRGRSWDAVHDDMRLTAATFSACIAVVRGVVSRLDTWIEDAFAWRRRSVREVAEIESVRCEQFDVAARDLMTLSSETGVVVARGLMKIDAEQITVG